MSAQASEASRDVSFWPDAASHPIIGARPAQSQQPRRSYFLKGLQGTHETTRKPTLGFSIMMAPRSINPEYEPADLRVDSDFFDLLTESYFRIIGKPLVAAGQSPSWLYNNAPFVVLAHNMEPDPRFIYANKAGQACFEYSWNEFTGLPSRLSAEADDRADRQQVLDAVAHNGFIAGYQGLRIAKSGRRFRMEDGVVWQLIDDNGVWRGQAATFSLWKDV